MVQEIAHEHTDQCIVQDIMDLGDDGDGYVAYEYTYCSVTGDSL